MYSLIALLLQDPGGINPESLYEPPAVAFSFDAPGWKYLFASIIITLLIIAVMLIRRYIRNRYRREAIKEILKWEGTPESILKTFSVLKSVAIYAYGREAVGELYGLNWLTFLDQTSREVSFLEYQDQVTEVMYKGNDIDPGISEKIIANSKKWVSTHHV